MKTFFAIIFACFTLMVTSEPLNTHKSSVKVVVIDAGHGGKDPGCLSQSKFQEKNVTLDIALKLGKILTDSFSDMKVIYTRTDDQFIELYQRAAIANRNQADLFISIHCNAHTNKDQHGAETYVMGVHKAEQNLEVLKRENGVLQLESEEYKHYYAGFDPNSPESLILMSLHQNAFLNQSLKLASKIQEKVTKRGVLADRGVKQAGFVVLWKTTMPSILVETGYLTNLYNEHYLISENGKNETALSIFEAVKEYKLSIEGSIN